MIGDREEPQWSRESRSPLGGSAGKLGLLSTGSHPSSPALWLPALSLERHDAGLSLYPTSELDATYVRHLSGPGETLSPCETATAWKPLLITSGQSSISECQWVPMALMGGLEWAFSYVGWVPMFELMGMGSSGDGKSCQRRWQSAIIKRSKLKFGLSLLWWADDWCVALLTLGTMLRFYPTKSGLAVAFKVSLTSYLPSRRCECISIMPSWRSGERHISREMTSIHWRRHISWQFLSGEHLCEALGGTGCVLVRIGAGRETEVTIHAKTPREKDFLGKLNTLDKTIKQKDHEGSDKQQGET